jgi:hypothetical protein
MYVFRNLIEIREHTELGLHNHNEEIPHTSLNGVTPVEYDQFHNLESPVYALTCSGAATRIRGRAGWDSQKMKVPKQQGWLFAIF